MKIDTLRCLKNPERDCYVKVITKDFIELQACLRSFSIVCEEEK